MELVEGLAPDRPVTETIAEIERVEDEHGTTVQAFDARYVTDERHLSRAVELARRAHERDDAIARELRVEILLYAAGRRQIDEALEMGISLGGAAVVVVVGGDEADAAAALCELFEPADTLDAGDPERIAAFFDIGTDELAATAGTLADVVHERVALLTVEK